MCCDHFGEGYIRISRPIEGVEDHGLTGKSLPFAGLQFHFFERRAGAPL